MHVSGHGSADELKTMLALIRPRAFIPVHGETRMLAAHARLAEAMGVDRDAHHRLRERRRARARAAARCGAAGEVEAGIVFVDGLGIGDPEGRRAARPPPALGRRRPDRGRAAAPQRRRTGPRSSRAASRPRARRPTSCSPRCAGARRRGAGRLDGDEIREHKLVQTHLHDAIAELVWERARKRPLIMPVVVDV